MKKICVSLLIIAFCAGIVHAHLQVKRPVQKRIQVIKSIKVLYPNGGEKWEIGKPYTIRWQSQGISGFVKIKLKWGTGSGGWFTVTNKTANSGSYRYTIPASGLGQRGSQFKIYVLSMDETVKDTSDRFFSIQQARQGIQAVAQVKFTKISRLESLDSSSRLQIKELEMLAEAKTLQQDRILQGWKNLNKKLLDKKMLLQEEVVKESFNKLIQKSKNQAQVFQKRAVLASEAERRLDKELKKARQYLKQIRVYSATNKPLPPFRAKDYTDIVRRIKDGQTSIRWDPGEMPVKSESEVSNYIQEVEAQIKTVRNERQMCSTEFENANQKATQYINMLSTVLKSMHEMQTGIIRNIR